MKNINDLKYFNIEVERLKAGLTVQELSQMVGISHARYPRIVRGTSPLDIVTLDRFCEIFGCDRDYLIQENNSNYGKSKKEAKEKYANV